MKQTHKKDLTNATNAIIVVTESQSNATERRGERVKTIQKLARLLAQTDERELTFRFERAEGETELFAKVAGLGKGRGQLRELGRILCFADN